MQLIQTCPCCHKHISFKELFLSWSSASKSDNKLIKCPYCKRPIQKLGVYEKHGMMAMIPLFALPWIYSSYPIGLWVGVAALLYGLLVFWLLYSWVPLICLEQSLKEEIKKDSSDDSVIVNLLIGVVVIVFFVSIVSMFFSFATTMKEKQQQKNFQKEANQLLQNKNIWGERRT